MTPKEKAEELVDRYNYNDKHYLMTDAKQCALIAVDEILSLFEQNKWDSKYEYYMAVKQEIENL